MQLYKAAADARTRKVPIRGRQLLYLIRTFYRVDNEMRLQFSLRNLLEVEYAGDASVAKFINDWDYMLANMGDDLKMLNDKFLEDILSRILRNSDLMRTHIEYYDRQLQDHPDRCYTFLYGMLKKVSEEKQQRKNKEQWLADGSVGKKVRTPANPVITPVPTRTHAPAPDPVGNRQQRRRDREGDSGSEGGADRPRGGPAWKDRCCIRNLWHKCEETVVDGSCSYGPHTRVVPEMLLTIPLYVKLLAEHGAPLDTKMAGDKGKGKGKGKDKGNGKGKGKGNGKGKPAATAIIVGEAAVAQP